MELTDFPELNIFTVKVICDRGVSHELVRHRVFSFAQESQRYVNYKKNGCFQFIEPSAFDEWDERTQKDYLICLNTCAETYNKMIESGRTPQEARAVLPNSTMACQDICCFRSWSCVFWKVRGKYTPICQLLLKK